MMMMMMMTVAVVMMMMMMMLRRLCTLRHGRTCGCWRCSDDDDDDDDGVRGDDDDDDDDDDWQALHFTTRANVRLLAVFRVSRAGEGLTGDNNHHPSDITGNEAQLWEAMQVREGSQTTGLRLEG
jgi:hypothetical protein